MNNRLLWKQCLCFIAAMALSGIVGCEEGIEIGRAEEPPIITPGAVLISKGQSIQFTATRGYSYLWSLEGNETWGHLSSREGPVTTYTSLHDPSGGSVDVQTLKVTSFIAGAPEDDTESTTRTAEAMIRHVSVTVDPAVVNLDQGQSIELRAEDGTRYQWFMRHDDWGTLSDLTGPVTVYTATNNPYVYTNVPSATNRVAVQVVTVRSFESEATATITHNVP